MVYEQLEKVSNERNIMRQSAQKFARGSGKSFKEIMVEGPELKSTPIDNIGLATNEANTVNDNTAEG